MSRVPSIDRVREPKLDCPGNRVEPKQRTRDSFEESDLDHVCRTGDAQDGTIFRPAQEVRMKRLFAIAAFLMTSTAAQAQYTFEYGGKTIRIDPDRGTVSIPGVYDNTGRKNKRLRNDQDSTRKQSPDKAKADPQTPAAAPAPAAAPVIAEPVPTPAKPSDPPTTTAKVTPAETVMPVQPAEPLQPQAAAPAQPIPQDEPPIAKPVPPPIVATAPPGPPPPTAIAQPANSPLGLWLTEEKEGRVRIEQCGANLCGYSVDPKSNKNGEQVLINMKPGKDSKWSGRIFDPNTGSTYDSTIALKGSDTLRVQGCAFGGMFCGGQTWSRLN
jgi:Uncharacterized protein conserved in bacteria (DUF2147)